MKKVAILVTLLAASSAFAAVSLTGAPTALVPDGSGNVVLTWTLTGADAANKVNGYSLYAVTVPGTIQVAGLVRSGVMSDANDAAAVGKILEDTGAVDMGATAAAGTYITNPAAAVVLTMTLKALVPATTGNPLSIDFYPFPTVNDAPIDGAIQTVTITPEPASMLLLAAGAAFFARRRRA